MRDQKARAVHHVWRKCLLHEDYVLVELTEDTRRDIRIICSTCSEYLAIRKGESARDFAQGLDNSPTKNPPSVDSP